MRKPRLLPALTLGALAAFLAAPASAGGFHLSIGGGRCYSPAYRTCRPVYRSARVCYARPHYVRYARPYYGTSRVYVRSRPTYRRGYVRHYDRSYYQPRYRSGSRVRVYIDD